MRFQNGDFCVGDIDDAIHRMGNDKRTREEEIII